MIQAPTYHDSFAVAMPPASPDLGERKRAIFAKYLAQHARVLRDGRPISKRMRAPRVRPPEGLRTKAEAAAKLGISTKTLDGYVDAGALRYVALGHGRQRVRRMFTDADLNEFITNQSRKDVPVCPSTRIRAHRTGNSTSGGEVIAFTAQPRPRPGAKPKR